MRQWSMRITAYADRLLTGLDGVDWSDSIKEQQRNWIGKSIGAEVTFDIENVVDKNQSLYDEGRYDLWCFLYGVSA